MKYAIAMLSILMATSATASDVSPGKLPACVSEEMFDEMMSAHAAGDQATWNWLFSNKRCIIVPAGINYRVVDRNIFSASRIRFFLPDGEFADLWGDPGNFQ